MYLILQKCTFILQYLEVHYTVIDPYLAFRDIHTKKQSGRGRANKAAEKRPRLLVLCADFSPSYFLPDRQHSKKLSIHTYVRFFFHLIHTGEKKLWGNKGKCREKYIYEEQQKMKAGFTEDLLKNLSPAF